MSLFSRNDDLPGIHGTVRDLTGANPVRGLKKFSVGDIAVVDAPDISRPAAQQLIDLHPAAVLNIASFSTGTVPNFGPQLMIDAQIPIFEELGAEARSRLRPNKHGRVTEEGELFHGEERVGTAKAVSAQDADRRFAEAQRGLVDHMEAFFGNTIQFIHSEAPLLIDGLGVPDTGLAIERRKVVIVSPGARHKEQLRGLRNFIREYDPVMIGVDAAADTLVADGITPDLIVGNPAGIGAEALRSGARVVLPADPDGHAAGLERIQDLGVGAMTFPAATRSATDLAILLANFHDADLVVNVGAPVDLDSVFAARPEATPAALLARFKAGAKLVDADAVIALYRVNANPGTGWLWAILGILVAAAVIILIAGGIGQGSFIDNLIDTWNSIALTVQGWFFNGNVQQ